MRGSHVHAALVYPPHDLCGVWTRLPSGPSTLREAVTLGPSASPLMDQRAKPGEGEPRSSEEEQRGNNPSSRRSCRPFWVYMAVSRSCRSAWVTFRSGGTPHPRSWMSSGPSLDMSVGGGHIQGPLRTVGLIPLNKETRARTHAHTHADPV